MRFKIILLPLLALLMLAVNLYAGTNTNETVSTNSILTSTSEKIVFEGGDGSSLEKAVLIKNAKGSTEGIAAESEWIKKRLPGWERGKQVMLSKNDRFYDVIEFTKPQGKTKGIYFDITEFFGK